MTARLLLACAALLAAAPCRAFWWGPRAQSLWRDRAIVIDGRDEDWQGQEAGDAQGVAFAFANDDQDLYVLLSPHTRSLKRQLAGDFKQDFTIWIDTSAGKRKAVGVKLSGETSPREAADVGMAADGAAAELRVGPMDERGVLEARIPLAGLGNPMPRIISVGFETSAPREGPAAEARHPGHEASGDQEPDPQMGRRGHGRKGGMAGKHGNAGSEERFEPLDVWVRVTLSPRSGKP